MCVFVYACVCASVYMCVFIQTCLSFCAICTQVYVRVCLSMCVCVHACECLPVYESVCVSLCVCLSMNVHVQGCVCEYECACEGCVCVWVCSEHLPIILCCLSGGYIPSAGDCVGFYVFRTVRGLKDPVRLVCP